VEKWRESLRPKIEKTRLMLQGCDPSELALHSGARHHDGQLVVSFLEKDFQIEFPSVVTMKKGSNQPVPEEIEALLLDYLAMARTALPKGGEWVAFRELPGGQFYASAFQGYAADTLVRAFGNDIEGFKDAAQKCHGTPLEMGDASFNFQVLPRLEIAVVYWGGDDEFPPHASVLFDTAASSRLPLDGLANVGRILCAQLVKFGSSKD